MVDEGLLIALSATALVGGTLAVARKIALRQFIRSCCAIGLGLIPWMMWQAHHRASVSYRNGIVLDAGASCNTSVTTNPRDSARLISERAKFGGTHNHYIAMSPKPTDFNSSDTWVVAPSKHAGFGQLKSRPFAWKRMDGSTVLFSYGADTVHLKKWERPSVVE